MNLVGKNDCGEFCLVSVGARQDMSYVVSVVYLHSNGSLRVKGGDRIFDTEEEAQKGAENIFRKKVKKKGYCRASVDDLPIKAHDYLRANIDISISEEEMLNFVREAKLERYVEFNCVLGIEDRFDEGLEYLAIKNEKEEGFYYVWDRYGVKCHCHDSRFSRLEPTERAEQAKDLLPDYCCPKCQDSIYGCASCTS